MKQIRHRCDRHYGNIDPANPDASVPGQVYFAVVMNGDMQAYSIELEPQPTRLAYKLAVAKEILDVLMPRLNQAFDESGV